HPPAPTRFGARPSRESDLSVPVRPGRWRPRDIAPRPGPTSARRRFSRLCRWKDLALREPGLESPGPRGVRPGPSLHNNSTVADFFAVLPSGWHARRFQWAEEV